MAYGHMPVKFALSYGPRSKCADLPVTDKYFTLTFLCGKLLIMIKIFEFIAIIIEEGAHENKGFYW